MADICMCTNHECPVRMKCYRYTATATPMWQGYFYPDPEYNDGCEHFWDNKR